jgi:hypothetical protein
MTKAPTSNKAAMVSWARLAVMFSSRPTPTTASPPVVADDLPEEAAGPRIGDGRLHVLEHFGVILER